MAITDLLTSEHTHIERLSRILMAAADDFQQGKVLTPNFFIGAAQFIRVYADGLHHRKEEGILFPAITPVMTKAVEVLLCEHELARGFTRSMDEAAQAWQAGDETSAPEAVRNARNYAALLHGHILHENGVVFPSTNWLISSAAQTRMSDQCGSVQTEPAEASQMLALLDQLEAQLEPRKQYL